MTWNWHTRFMVFIMLPICLFCIVESLVNPATETQRTYKCNCCCRIDNCDIPIVSATQDE